MTHNTRATINETERQVLVTFSGSHISSVRDGKREVKHLLPLDEIKRIQAEIMAVNSVMERFTKALSNEGVPTAEFQQLIDEGRI